MTPRIRLLDDQTANQIAAGEVIERPASALKELVENSIDAGARHIHVALVDGGKRLIRVADDGCGMTQEESVLSLQRHATSKITSADDLSQVTTLGFRGEALPSIASVSRFTLTTRAAEEDSGTRLSVHGGEIDEVASIGTPAGTIIEVEDLFFNTPARLKFLKSTATETARAVEVVGHLAMSHPHIAFRLEVNGQETLASPGAGDPLGAVAAVWGRDIARKMARVEYESPGIAVHGFVCTPDLTRPGRSHELFFVNRRPIRNRLIGHALEHAFRSLTPDGRFPIAALFFEIAPELVDVNVHPTKAEVKFTRDGEIHHAASEAIKRSLLENGIVPQLGAGHLREWGQPAPAQSAVPGWQPPYQPQLTYETLRAAVDLFAPLGSDSAAQLTSSERLDDGLPANQPVVFQEPDPFAEPIATSPTAPFGEQLRAFRVIGQARNTYIIALTEQGIAIVDQHVAHERVLYERLTKKRAEHGVMTQLLVTPITLKLDAAEAALLDQRLDDFRLAGWEIEPFGAATFLVRGTPAALNRSDCEAVLKDMIDELVHLSVSRRLIVQRDHVTITNACKMAVKAGDPLTHEEMTGLLHQLAETDNPYLCPHGRPIVVTIPFGEIDRKFKRA